MILMSLLKKIGYTLAGTAIASGLAAWLWAANTDRPKDMKSLDGDVISLLSPDVTGETAEAIIDAFEGDPKNSNRLQLNGLYGHGMELGSGTLKDKTEDGTIHIQDSGLFHQRDLTITPYKDGRGAYIISMNGKEKIFFPSLSRPLINIGNIDRFEDLSDYTELENTFNERTLLVHSDLFEQSFKEHDFTIDRSSQVVDLVAAGYVLENSRGKRIILPKNTMYGVSSEITERQLQDGLYIGNESSPGQYYEEYKYAQQHGTSIEDTLEGILSTPETKVVLFGENHSGNSGIHLIAEMVDMLKTHGYSLGLEQDPDSTAKYTERTLQESLDAFYADETTSSSLDPYFSRNSMSDLIAACKKAGVEVIPFEDREKVKEAFYTDRDNFIETRDFFMDRNISDYMQRTGKRVAMIVGRAHASELPIDNLPGGTEYRRDLFSTGFFMGEQEVISFSYDEQKPLAKRLNERFGDAAIVQIGLYDDNVLLQDRMIAEGLRNNQVPENMAKQIRIIADLKRLTRGSGLAFKFEGHSTPMNILGMEYGIVATDYRDLHAQDKI